VKDLECVLLVQVDYVIVFIRLQGNCTGVVSVMDPL